MKRVLSVLLALMLLAACQPQAAKTEASAENDPSKPIPLGQTEKAEAFSTEVDGSPAKPGSGDDAGATEPAEVKKPGANVKDGVKAQFQDGDYTGKGRGNNGDVIATVVIKDGYIHSIRIDGTAETPSIFNTVIDDLVPRVIYEQTSQVEATSGATLSSQGAIEAIQKALDQAIPQEKTE